MVAIAHLGLGKFAIFGLLMLSGITVAQNASDCIDISITKNITYGFIPLIELQWTTNPCALLYYVSHYVNGELSVQVTLPHPLSSLNLEGIFCSENSITILTLVVPGLGSSTNSSIDFNIGVNGTTTVDNLRFNGNLSRFEWDDVNVSPGCNQTVEYEVNFENENVRENVIVTNATFQIPDQPCTTNVINVTAVVGSNISRSDPVGAVVTRSVSREPPLHISTIPGVNNVSVLWQVRNESNNICEVEGLQFLLTSNATQGELVINEYFNLNASLINVTIEFLQPDTLYTYRVCYVMAQSNTTICSYPIHFITLPGNATVPSTSLWAQLTSNGFIVFWNNNSTDFVTGYTLRIQPLGPAHFVPSDCLFDLYSIERYFDSSNVSSYNFTFAEPSFNYSVQLQSHSDGINSTNGTSEQIWVTTREGIPGDLSIRSSYLGAPSSPYDVTLRADWNIPCDINGRVQRFVYTLTGTLTSRSNVICRDVVLGGGAIEVSGYLEKQETFTILIPDILPTFNYTLWISTQVGYWNTTTALDIGPAPQAYTSPDWKCNSWTYL
ncbi:hypothetical protein Trydic_g3026 [Trypoxylus dichotomus]